MRASHGLRVLGCSGLMIAAATTGVGQVVLPPPPAPPKEPEFVPPPAQAPEAQANPTGPNPVAATPGRTGEPRRVIDPGLAERAKAERAKLTGAKARAMARPIEIPLGAEYAGPLLRYTRPLDLESLRYNPLVTEDHAKQVRVLLSQRRERFERVILENLQITEDIRAGLIDGLSFVADRETMSQIAVVLEDMKKIYPNEKMIDEAVRLGMVPDVAREVSYRLIGEYNAAFQATVAQNDPQSATDEFFRAVLRNDTYEALNTYEDLLVEAATRTGPVLAAVGEAIPSGLRAALAGLRTERAAVETNHEARRALVARFDLALRGSGLEQRAALLKAVIDSRTSPDDRLLPILSLDRPADFANDNPGLDLSGL